MCSREKTETQTPHTAHRPATKMDGKNLCFVLLVLIAGQRHSCSASDTRRKNVRPNSFAFIRWNIGGEANKKSVLCVVTPNGHGIRTFSGGGPATASHKIAMTKKRLLCYSAGTCHSAECRTIQLGIVKMKNTRRLAQPRDSGRDLCCASAHPPALRPDDGNSFSQRHVKMPPRSTCRIFLPLFTRSVAALYARDTYFAYLVNFLASVCASAVIVLPSHPRYGSVKWVFIEAF